MGRKSYFLICFTMVKNSRDNHLGGFNTQFFLNSGNSNIKDDPH